MLAVFAEGTSGTLLANVFPVVEEEPRCWIEIVLLPRGAVHVRAGVEGDPPCAFEVVKETPSGALRALSNWLEENAGANFTAVIRSATGPIVTWSTTSISTTMYWAATVLGQACAATIALPRATEQRETARSTGVHAIPDATVAARRRVAS